MKLEDYPCPECGHPKHKIIFEKGDKVWLKYEHNTYIEVGEIHEIKTNDKEEYIIIKNYKTI